MKNYHPQFSAMAIFLVLLSCGTGQQKEAKSEITSTKTPGSIMVFAAASLTDVLPEIIDSFEVRYGVDVKTNMASSGTLARQMEQGGEPDVYISASKRWADYVDSLGYYLAETKSAIVKNELVLIAPLNSEMEVAAIDSGLDFIQLLKDERLSMGDPAHVPAGKYAKQSLEYYEWYAKLGGKTLPAKDVRSALMVVEMEEAPLGIVYRTDARKSGKVKILNAFPEASHKPIVYMGGVCEDNAIARDFLEYVNSDATRSIWAKYGFKK